MYTNPSADTAPWLGQAMESGQLDYDSDSSSYTSELQSWDEETDRQDAEARNSGEATFSGRDDRRLPNRDAKLLSRADAGLLSDEDKAELSEAAGFSLLQKEKPGPSAQMPLMWLASCLAPVSMHISASTPNSHYHIASAARCSLDKVFCTFHGHDGGHAFLLNADCA